MLGLSSGTKTMKYLLWETTEVFLPITVKAAPQFIEDLVSILNTVDGNCSLFRHTVFEGQSVVKGTSFKSSYSSWTLIFAASFR